MENIISGLIIITLLVIIYKKDKQIKQLKNELKCKETKITDVKIDIVSN